MKFREKTKDCRLTVRARAWFGESFNQEELDRFSKTYMRGFLKPRTIHKNSVEMTGPVGISLHAYLLHPVTFRDFLMILEQVLLAVKKLQNYGFDTADMVMDIHNAYINEVTQEVQLIYLPVISGQHRPDLRDFIESILYSVSPAARADSDAIAQFAYFLKSFQGINVRKLESYIEQQDRYVTNLFKKQQTSQSDYITDKVQDYIVHYDGQDMDEDATSLLQEDEDDDATSLLQEDEDDEATGLLQEDEDNTDLLHEDEDDEATGLLQDDEEDEATGLLENEDDPMECDKWVSCPYLIRQSNHDRISINKPIFRMGRERRYADFPITDNIMISQRHVDIVSRGERYFVIDLQSKNHTFINDRELPVQAEVEIRDGDRLKLANEEFVFYV